VLTLSESELLELTGYTRAAEQLAECWARFVKAPSDLDAIDYRPFSGEGAGVYVLFRGDALLYVGKAVHLNYRLRTHFAERRIPFDNYCLIECGPEFAPFIECAYIFALQPVYNRKFKRIEFGGLDAMIADIKRIWDPERE
jgi:hypothetical protein